MVASVVAAFPGCPRLLQWMCTGCGSWGALAAPASVSRILRGVTALDPTASSRPLPLPAALPPPPPPPRLHPARPPEFTLLIAYVMAAVSSQPSYPPDP